MSESLSWLASGHSNPTRQANHAGGDSHPDGSTLSAQADAGAVSADWLLLLYLWRGRQESAGDPYKFGSAGSREWFALRASQSD